MSYFKSSFVYANDMLFEIEANVGIIVLQTLEMNEL